MVAVHASEMGKDFWIEDFNNSPCSAWTQVAVVYPDQVRPSPGFDLVRDDAFNKFFEEVRKGRNVEATYEGRFDVAFVWREHKRIDVGSEKGYGRKHRYGARIVLHKISDVISHPPLPQVIPGERVSPGRYSGSCGRPEIFFLIAAQLVPADPGRTAAPIRWLFP